MKKSFMKKLNLFLIAFLTLPLILTQIEPVTAQNSDIPKLDKESQFAMDIFTGKVMPQLEDPDLKITDIICKQNTNSLKPKSVIVDIRKISSTTYKATIIETQEIRTTLEDTHQEIFCDVTFFVTAVYDKQSCPDPHIRYCYKITGVKGGIIRKTDPQIIVTKLTLGCEGHGEYYPNAQPPKGNKVTKNLQKYIKQNPAVGTTYSTSGFPNNYYYVTEDGFSGISARTYIYIKRNGSGYTDYNYAEWKLGTSYGDWI